MIDVSDHHSHEGVIMLATQDRLDGLGQQIGAIAQVFSRGSGVLTPSYEPPGTSFRDRFATAAHEFVQDRDLAAARGFLKELDAVMARAADEQGGEIPDGSTTVTITTITITTADAPGGQA